MFIGVQGVEHPVVKRAVVLKFQGAERVGNIFDSIRDAVGVIVHRVDTPLVSGAVMVGSQDPV